MTQFVFNLRVYGLLINEKNEILLSEQMFQDVFLKKFPGGGVNYGEGLITALKREFREELGMDINVVRHFYTTDFFVPSMFHSDNQIISVFYIVDAEKNSPYDPAYQSPEGEKHKWVKIDQLGKEEFILPIEKVVAGKLIKEFGTD